MNTGKILFPQLMDFLPWTTDGHADLRPVWRRSPGPDDMFLAEQYRSMAFAQLTYRGLRDIKPASRSTHRNSMNIGLPPAGPARRWFDANESATTYPAALAQRLITQARTLYVDGTGVGPAIRVATPWTRRPSLWPVGSVGALRHDQGGGEDASRCSTCGATFRVLSTSDGGCTTFTALDMLLEAGAIYVVRIVAARRPTSAPFMCCTNGAFFVTRAKSNIDAHRGLFGADGSLDRHHLRPDQSPWSPAVLHPSGLPRMRRIRFKDPESGKTLVFITNNPSFRTPTICALKSRWRWIAALKPLQVDQAAYRIKQFYGTSENAVKTQIWIAVSVYVLVAIVKKRPMGDLDYASLYMLQIRRIFGKCPIQLSTCGRRKQMQRFANNQGN